jgi:hypothetical protein
LIGWRELRQEIYKLGCVLEQDVWYIPLKQGRPCGWIIVLTAAILHGFLVRINTNGSLQLSCSSMTNIFLSIVAGWNQRSHERRTKENT